ncbi:hypothetical protein OS493_010547 [Desmophyllum pertusum]|uniref:Uncharacterized protein n=1 Tax=Desmophyllum pertusum TaxID=174260 RepID=A0A9X0A3Q0_9CNID|nr:hypothetical protein OS493_010547 [Desmophyllum pertusum]
MSSSNVLPSAPPYDSEKLYPALPQPENFRLTKITEIEKDIGNEVEHYRKVAKKYKKVRTVIHYGAIGLGSTAACLSAGAFATSLTGIGIVIRAPLASVSALCGFASAGMAGATKKLESKISKHKKLYTLAVAKRDSISGLVSKALDDNKVTDDEFRIINSEILKYGDLKATVRINFKKPDSPHAPNLDKIRKEIRDEEPRFNMLPNLIKRITMKLLDLFWAQNQAGETGLSDRSKLVKQRNNIRLGIRALAKSLETKEAEIGLVDQEIQQLEIAAQEGSDGEED